MTKFHCLVAITSCDTGQYVYCNYLFPRLWHHKFCSYSWLSYQVVINLTYPKISGQKFKYLKNEKSF